MDDLIGRDKLIEELDLAIANGRVGSFDDVFDIIDEQPTAYDAKKVVEEHAKWHIVTDGDLPEDFQEVNVTWVNHNPVKYYKEIKDIQFNGCAVYYDGNWYWYTPSTVDMLKEYGNRFINVLFDSDIEVIAWMPLPEPYKTDMRGDK